MPISPELEATLWSDAAILNDLEATKQAFEQGDRTALFGAIALCARFQAVIPEWAADAILEIETKLRNGQMRDFHEAFGQNLEKQLSRRKAAKRERFRHKVLELLQDYRLDDGRINDDEAFQPIADQLGIGRRDVKAIYESYGQFIKALPREPSRNQKFSSTHMIVPVPRRRGRKILTDQSDD